MGAIPGDPGALAPFSGFAPPADGTPQFAPQGVLGNLIGDPGKPGFPFGGPVPGTQIGSVAGQLGRYLPFSVHPFGSGAPGATPPPEEDPPAS
ncbi:MAG TPA: hypothetical protein VN029_08090 [Sphingomonas sp.]|nr:hypothetical protein [Sphingomonas sp.]